VSLPKSGAKACGRLQTSVSPICYIRLTGEDDRVERKGPSDGGEQRRGLIDRNQTIQHSVSPGTRGKDNASRWRKRKRRVAAKRMHPGWARRTASQGTGNKLSEEFLARRQWRRVMLGGKQIRKMALCNVWGSVISRQRKTKSVLSSTSDLLTNYQRQCDAETAGCFLSKGLCWLLAFRKRPGGSEKPGAAAELGKNLGHLHVLSS